MIRHRFRVHHRWATLFAFSLITMILGCSGESESTTTAGAPTTQEGKSARPSDLFEKRPVGHLPPLATAGDVEAFVSFAASSIPAERELVREEVTMAAGNPSVVAALIEECERTALTDQTRALIAISLLGEMRADEGAAWLFDFAMRPPPEGDVIRDGGDTLAYAFAQLQAKAVDGLAYMQSRDYDIAVLRLIASHPDVIVRAEAIRAYLSNHSADPEARNAVIAYVQDGEERYVDRVNRDAGEDAESFDAKLSAYLRLHPEVLPPTPAHASGTHGKNSNRYSYDVAPPQF